MEKKWELAGEAPEEWHNQFPELSGLLRQLLWNRGLRERPEVEQFLNPSFEKDLHDPFLFKDMQKAVDRIFLAIEKKEKVFVYGDYDADGVPGATILKSTLDAMGAVTGIYIPHREREGYGLNKGAVEYMAGEQGKIIITCDCGISNAPETAFAQEKGIDVIITDHHRIPEVIPKAFAILHPLIPGEVYPNKLLTGGGVAFKFVCALVQRSQMSGVKCQVLEKGFEKWLLDLVAISTVADVGRLTGENRTLVKYGLTVINKTRRLGLQKLIEVAGLKLGSLDTFSLGWQIAPRINAAGRMDHANGAFNLLMADSPEEATLLARELNESNVRRQKATEEVMKGARKQLGDGQGAFLLAAFDPAWNPGVIGLVAGRLMEEFRKPVLIGTKNEMGVLVASARSISEFNIVEALAVSKQFLQKFGGHPKAAGFSVESEAQWAALIKHLQDMAFTALHELDIRPTLTIDADLTLTEVDWELWKSVAALEPCGEGNRTPRFLVHGIQVVGFDGVGNGGKHLRLTVTDESRKPRKMIGFNCGVWCQKLTVGDRIDAVVEVGVNEWNGKKDLELKIIDLRFHEVK